MHTKKLNKQELSLLDIMSAELAKLNDEIETEQASQIRKALEAHRREVIRQINKLLNHN